MQGCALGLERLGLETLKVSSRTNLPTSRSRLRLKTQRLDLDRLKFCNSKQNAYIFTFSVAYPLHDLRFFILVTQATLLNCNQLSALFTTPASSAASERVFSKAAWPHNKANSFKAIDGCAFKISFHEMQCTAPYCMFHR